jgi:hypothetical protein
MRALLDSPVAQDRFRTLLRDKTRDLIKAGSKLKIRGLLRQFGGSNGTRDLAEMIQIWRDYDR